LRNAVLHPSHPSRKAELPDNISSPSMDCSSARSSDSFGPQDGSMSEKSRVMCISGVFIGAG
jgi:hypothetical protein